ncbi:hypothetical protein BCU68_07710 [Vibrio sp. 10N.286.49.B3]|uniref:hypothetical protein n=1 Tax=Vibrio sp. 10N.286.49.B3 TaxID=1880855 RepID=UPI000C821D17|nr:hypothetical protein [Vibrio sp. 10N.286.49.B3]PMH37493.1 hypothetical protein BCU68_07710 [Vibrio sp. 10N.286.49.B3]
MILKTVALAFTFAMLLNGCSSGNTKHDNYMEASFELCNTEVKLYSVSDDERVRIICDDDSKFTLKSEDTLETMREININYCDGEGLGKFSESSNYYSFRCKSGTLLSIPK